MTARVFCGKISRLSIAHISERVEPIRGENMSIIVCTVSGKGGTGKSTVSSGLGIAAANMDKRVLLIDLDAGLRCLDMIFGIDDKVVFDLGDALETLDAQKALYTASNYENISVIPAPANPVKIDFARLNAFIDKVLSDYDFIILDFPAGTDFENYNCFPDAVFLIVSGTDGVSVRDAATVSAGIKTKSPPRLIINRFDIDLMTGGLCKNIDGIIDASFTKLIGIVPADGELLVLQRNHQLKSKGRAARAFNRIIRRISGEDVRLPKLKKI